MELLGSSSVIAGLIYVVILWCVVGLRFQLIIDNFYIKDNYPYSLPVRLLIYGPVVWAGFLIYWGGVLATAAQGLFLFACFKVYSELKK